jgi:hypothetical protein
VSKPRLDMAGPLRIARFAMAWACALAATVHAERMPLRPDRLVEESDLIVTGRILARKIGTERSHLESGFGNYDWAIDLTLKIQEVEKGQLDQSDTIVVRCFRFKTRKSKYEMFCPSGNRPIPDVGADVRAHLYRRGDFWRVVFPNGLTPVADHMPLADAAAIRALSSRAYTYWLPLEGWICIAVLGTVLLLSLRLIRRFRRRSPRN